MQRTLFFVATLVLGASLAAPASAHHSFAMFDNSRLVTQTGTIKKVEWANPHVWLWISVPKSDGTAEDWPLEAGGPSQMTRMGIPRELFKDGAKISFDCYPMRDGKPGGQFRHALLADGTKIDVGAAVSKFASGG